LDTELIQGFIEPVYRYHLARCENYLEAQNLTVQTLSTVMKWIDTYRSGQDSLKTWVMGIAHDRQSFGPRYSTMAVKRLAGASAFTSSSPSSDHEPLLPEQGEILLRDRMSHLSSSWKRLPAKQADALALHYFSGLGLAEVGAVLHKPESAVRALVAHGTVFEAELLELADSIHPDKDFLSRFQNELIRPGARQRSWLPHWLKPDIWQPSYSAWRRFFRMGPRLSQMGLLIGILVLGFYMIQRQSIVPSQGQPTPTREVTPTTAVQVAAAPLIANAMVPPDLGACQTWKKNLENLAYTTFSLSDSANFTDPTGSPLAISGTGCELDATITGNTQDSAPKTVSDISLLFFDNGFSLGNGFDNLPNNPASTFFPQNCPGFGRSYQKDDLYVYLSASYCASLSAQEGPGSPGIRGYTLRLILTSSSVQTSLDRFFSLWASGNNQAISNLSPALRNKYPTIRALDFMAGLSRSPSKTISFIWQPVQNSGASLRVEVLAKEMDSQKTSDGPQPTFQIVLTQDNGLWAISDAAKTSLFAASTDSVIYADAQGQIFQPQM
jgi:DNA-directed RNA polymerase specialized sigma24 family protein